ncbi:MAG: ABC transporter substrate-binding protein [Cryobacterium sp.]|nr:ABC transporter substrate-binding protein [Oligoflexia bacterium]
MSRLNFLSALALCLTHSWFIHFPSALGEDRRPERVVTLLPSIAEIALEVGLPEANLVGVSEFTDFPPSLKNKTSIGNYAKPSIERIVGLVPDLVVTDRDSAQPVSEKLEKLKFRVLRVGTASLSDIRQAYHLVADALLRTEAGNDAIHRFDLKIDEIRLRAETRKKKEPRKVRVLLTVNEEPLIVAGGKNFLDDGVALVGAENIYHDSNSAYPRVSVEDVIKRNPDVVLLLDSSTDLVRAERAKKRWLKIPGFRPAKNARVVIVKSDALIRPGPRFPSGLRDLESAIYGPEPIRKPHE